MDYSGAPAISTRTPTAAIAHSSRLVFDSVPNPMPYQHHVTTRTSRNVIPAICLLVLTTGGCLNHAGIPTPPSPRIPWRPTGSAQVVVTEAKSIVWPRTVHVQGNLLSDERVVVGAKVAGRIASLGEDILHQPVELGSEVRAGDVLARLETAELELKVQQAESQLEQVRATLGLEKDQEESQLDPSKVPSVVQEKALWDAAQDNWSRAKALERETAISGEELQQRKSLVDVAAARYESALHSVNESIAMLGVRRAELGLARQALQDAEIRAPFDGRDRAAVCRAGAYVQVGQPVVVLVKVDPWRFRASVPEREATAVQVGQRVTIRIEGEQTNLDAVIVRISPSVEMSNRALTVEAVERPDSRVGQAARGRACRGPQLRRGLFAEADIHVDPTAQTLAVPRAAMREFAGVEKVWCVVDGEATEQRVETGRQNDAYVEILSGLSAGDVVVVDGFPKQAGPVEVVSVTTVSHCDELLTAMLLTEADRVQWLARVCVERPVFAMMLIAAMVVAGAASYLQLGVDRFPRMDLPSVYVRTTYRGAAPQEIETEITQRLEDAVATVEGIDELRSVSSDGVSLLLLTFESTATSTRPHRTCATRSTACSTACRPAQIRP